MKRIALLVISLLILNIQPANAADVLPNSFFTHLGSKYLGNTGVILIDSNNQSIVYEKSSNTLRPPASVLKLVATTSIAMTLDSTTVFRTAIYQGNKPGSFVIIGENDPWITSSIKSRNQFKRAYLPTLLNAALKKRNNLRVVSIQYSGVSSTDINYARRIMRKTSSIKATALPGKVDTTTILGEKIAEIVSPKLSAMIRFTNLYSDNNLSQKLARLAAINSGFPGNQYGINAMAQSKLGELGVSTDGMHLEDASGLSQNNKISATTVSQLLLKIKSEPRLGVVYHSLPVGGVSGTLTNRYIKTAPQAIGLVKAKTGSIKNTVSLAGYVTSGSTEYVFVVIANQAGKTRRSQDAARGAIDKMLGSIAKPFVIPTTSTPDSTTVIN
jgi:D-alanyl-D-alanine carboxypeptidase/D-alanyl-D-alanine-endopeptidase (penicillin-binding protein 4)